MLVHEWYIGEASNSSINPRNSKQNGVSISHPHQLENDQIPLLNSLPRTTLQLQPDRIVRLDTKQPRCVFAQLPNIIHYRTSNEILLSVPAGEVGWWNALGEALELGADVASTKKRVEGGCEDVESEVMGGRTTYLGTVKGTAGIYSTLESPAPLCCASTACTTSQCPNHINVPSETRVYNDD